MLASLENAVRSSYDWPLGFQRLAVVSARREGDWLLAYLLQNVLEVQQADLLVVESFTHLGRNACEVMTFLDWCNQLGVRLLALADGFDSMAS